MTRPPHDPSVEWEPHLSGQSFQADASEDRAAARLSAEQSQATRDAQVDHSVWDEPSLTVERSGPDQQNQLTYAGWLRERIDNTSWTTSWLVTIGLILVAGPWGVIGALFFGGTADVSMVGLVTAVILAPVTEEITKIAATLWVIEKRPYWLKSAGQILFSAAAGGLAFGVIENLIYLNIYVPEGGSDFARWRWGVCTTLHVSCSLLAGVGMVRIWGHTMRDLTRPNLGLGMPWIFTAMVCHGLYNLSVSVAELVGWLSFD
jgi:RsiW-degrading membrane proteinase PrsW (M82 family)